MPAKLDPPPTQPTTTSGYSPAFSICATDSWPDDGLVQQHVVQHRSERVVGARRRRPPPRPPRRSRCRASPVGCEACARPASVSVGGAAVHRRAPHLHHRAAVGLLVVARADHEHLALHVHQPAGEGERGAPLPGARSPSRAGARPPRGCSRPAARPCWACASPPARCPRTCSRCAPGYRARARGAARGTAASGATACRSRAPRRGSRPPARPRPPARSGPSGRSASGRRAPRASRPGAAAARARRAGPASGSPSASGSPPR